MKRVFEHQDLQIFGLELNFHPLEVVCRGGETQLQVGENLIIKFSGLKENSSRHYTYINPMLV